MKREGFTIVELLIVIVIIAVLAAITIVSYSGVQQRANNAAIIDAASKSLRMIQGYIALNGSYPVSSIACITTTTGCLWGGTVYNTNATFDTNVATIGTLPRQTPVISPLHKGVIYDYNAVRTMNGVVQPAMLVYYLSGTSQQCGVGGVTNSGGLTMISSVSGYTAGNDGNGRTACVVSIVGPSL